MFPGKELTTADALSRAPSKSTSRVKQEEEIEFCVKNILLQLPSSDKGLDEIATDRPTGRVRPDLQAL